MLKTKCIKKERCLADGLRISVMSRHTLSDGKTPDPDITQESFAEWRKELAPPPKLVGSWYRGEITWNEFENRYREYLADSAVHKVVLQLIASAQKNDVTIMCVEPTPENCHRRLLAEYCQKIEPSLEIEIN